MKLNVGASSKKMVSNILKNIECFNYNKNSIFIFY